MRSLFFSFCFLNLFFLYAPAPDVENEGEVKVDLAVEKKRTVSGKIKDLLNSDMTHHYNVFGGFKMEIAGVSVWGGINTIIYSDKYHGKVPEDEFQWSAIRNMFCEIGVSSEFIPFFGLEISVFSKEFLNGGAEALKVLSGGKVGMFCHFSRFNVSGGLFIKEGHKGLFDIKNHGVAIYLSVKYTKTPVVVGGGLIS